MDKMEIVKFIINDIIVIGINSIFQYVNIFKSKKIESKQKEERACDIIKNKNGLPIELQNMLLNDLFPNKKEFTKDQLESMQQTLKQYQFNNINNIYDKAKEIFIREQPHSKISEKIKNLTQTWILNFMDNIKFISDEQIQELFARILSGEIQQPGSYSLRTIEFLKNLKKEELELCIKLMKYICAEKYLIKNDLKETQGEVSVFSLVELNLLFELNIIDNKDQQLTLEQPKNLNNSEYWLANLGYFNNNISFLLADTKLNIVFRDYTLTNLGKELYKIIDIQKFEIEDDYFIKMKEKYKTQGFEKIQLCSLSNQVIKEY